MARLYADANFPRPTVEKLRRLGHDVTTVQQTEGTSRPETPMDDEQVLDVATRQNRIVLTINVSDFEKLHEASRKHSGIIGCKTDLDFKRQARMIDDKIKEVGNLASQIHYISPPLLSGKSKRKSRRKK
jgi:hypothetical protein